MAKAEEQAETMNPAIAFIRLGRFPYAIEAMLRGAVGALCYAYECVQLLVHLQARLTLHSHQQRVDVKRIFLSHGHGNFQASSICPSPSFQVNNQDTPTRPLL